MGTYYIDKSKKHANGRYSVEAVDKTGILDGDFQGNAVVNYTDRETPYTRIIEQKHFEFGEQDKTVISYEFSEEWSPGIEPYYPIGDEKNQNLYEQYRKLADSERNVCFGGRLGSYKYYDMDKTVEEALSLYKNIK
jgi:UDP-galactopyranose mutase